MASIEVLNATQANVEAPIEIQLSLGNPIYRGPEGKAPVKGVDYFTQEDIDNIVAQIKGDEGIDLASYATKAYVDEAVEGVVVEETDPTVPEWAKQANKPTYTANEVGALPADTVLFSGNYEDLSNKPTIPVVPINVSSFTNDAGYLTTHQNLTDYATKSYVETAIRGAESGLLKRSVVQALPVSEIDDNTIYMVPKTGSTGDVYDEYLYVNNVWEHIGSTDIDLTGYATEDYVNDRKFPYLDLKKLIQKSGVRWNDNTWRAKRDASNPYITELFNIFEYAVYNGYYLKNYSGIYFDGYIYYPHSNKNGYTTISIQNWQDRLQGNTLYVNMYDDYLVIRQQQTFQPTLYDAGTGISISNSTISINTQYLTNSDILAIWNGENN